VGQRSAGEVRHAAHAFSRVRQTPKIHDCPADVVGVGRGAFYLMIQPLRAMSIETAAASRHPEM